MPGRAQTSRGVSALFAGEAGAARSGLAYAAGFAGLAFLFRHSAASLGSEWFGLPWLFLTYLLGGAAAPAAMALGLAAAAELDRSPRTAGRAQALVGYLIGLCGTLQLVNEAEAWFRAFGH